GGAIDQTVRPLLAEAPEPLVGGSYAHAGRMGRFFHAQALNKDALDKQGSTAGAQTGMFMQVHPGLLWAGLASQPPSSRDAPDEQPTERSHLVTGHVGPVHRHAACCIGT